ncbi:MAG: glycosyltransferase [Azospirillum sp.]|nr:glycosyltransferase [Azospirillum sp.]
MAIDEPTRNNPAKPARTAAATGGRRRPLVVLQVLPGLVTGGAERGCIDVAVALAQAGGSPVVASSGGPMVRELDRAGIPHLTLPLDSKHPWQLYRNIGRLATIIREMGVDIVHARSRAPAWSAWYAARRTGVHFMTTFHAPYNFDGRWKLAYNSIMARGERVIAISDFIRQHILAYYATPPEAIRVIHRGIDRAIFAPDRVPALRLIQLARSWRLPDDRKVILLPGRLTRWKGQIDFIEALTRLGRQDISAVLVGSDQGRTGYRRELEQLIEQRGLQGVVFIVDHCNDMPAAYMMANVVVSASREPEAFGRVIVEAQAMGRPVVVTGIGAVQETVVPGETAWVVPPRDPPALAEAIAAALELSPEQRSHRAERAIAHVGDRFTREKMCSETLGVYYELMR